MVDVDVNNCSELCTNKFQGSKLTKRSPYRSNEMSKDKMEKFFARIKKACKLKTVREESDLPRRGDGSTNEFEQPDVTDSGEDSPSFSGHGPYIPISECFTGQPIRYNGQYPSPTSFPFPPVKWDTHPKDQRTAPPRPPKKSPSVTSATFNEMTAGAANKSGDLNEDGQDSSSTSSSLQSPLASGDMIYTNMPEVSPSNKSPGCIVVGPAAEASTMVSPVSPPKVDRNLKPDLRRTSESPTIYNGVPTPSHTTNNVKLYPSGTKTLPLKMPTKATPPTSNPAFELGPTPAQRERAKQRGPQPVARPNGSATLPRKRPGPAHHVSESASSYAFIENYPQELNYLVIDCVNTDGDSRAATAKLPTQHRNHYPATTIESASVEYKQIDHIKTQALQEASKEQDELRMKQANKHVK